ncbi:MAG: hypothetical protein V4573_16295 [Pseudomonadota bacterium]|nr:hypothetical protein [Polaromonas sp.]
MSDFQTEPFTGQAGRPVPAAEYAFPAPPKLHWAFVLLFSVFTLGIFMIVWMFIQSSWARKIDAASHATAQFVGYVVLFLLSQIFDLASSEGLKAVSVLFLLGSYIAFYFGTYSIRRSMLDHYNNMEPMQLKLSAAMTFFFSTFYLQYHMTRIARWKAGGTLAS